MKKDKANGIVIGVFYILAAVGAVMAVLLYNPLLSDNWYMTVLNGLELSILLGVVSDIVLIISAVGTAIMLFPYVRLGNEQAALGYLCFRFMEAVFIAMGVISVLGLLNLSSSYHAGDVASNETYRYLGMIMQSIHSWSQILGPNIMLGLNTFLYSYLLYKTEIIPKRLSAFGMITAVLVFLAGWLNMFGIIGTFSAIKGIIALPVGLYELSLATWLIIKGFNKEKLIALRLKRE